jgi:hypothetical protein
VGSPTPPFRKAKPIRWRGSPSVVPRERRRVAGSEAGFGNLALHVKTKTHPWSAGRNFVIDLGVQGWAATNN